METQAKTYDCGIIGGGLAGLCLAIQLADRGVSVVLFEKNQFPFHKVCGEYISLESWDFLKSLALDLDALSLPVITNLGISSEKGFMLEHKLQMGGFGISRFSLDHTLARIASSKGVDIREHCRVNGLQNNGQEGFEVKTGLGNFHVKILCGSYGKYMPQFLSPEVSQEMAAEAGNENNYIGVKYHIKTDLSPNRIELHNFKDGYCGVSKVDQDWHCLCYLTTSRNLQENGKDIKAMEANVLQKNPFLKNYFSRADFINPNPLVISNVHFSKKQTQTDGVFLLGDAAGSITPLCGNGMSMGMRASKILAGELIHYFEKKQTKEATAANYKTAWDNAFARRITAGYYLQGLFGKRNATDLALKTLDKLPRLTNKLVSLTHGDRF
ncbi:NAD(P)/FAD-dependent oxidoreductase [Dyadobacter fanqingshengii]|uniref:FAD-dependent monooxygenase n=1 Tax=Dyadobacter fanqingshengii TaxID=2906443 RepID=A0A9X1PBV5_9BACT|nr:FAD-dependent oxidoreductase [Dyadobacter fanqingshengii]MCF0041695.1 FAD-dependent monooxygenase [Dyadobacter fanqingshengii]USJ36591.1 FAD-dependent monooxygenase [Dyadobacter fanqingshengii]